jgi:hypothetical protein
MLRPFLDFMDSFKLFKTPNILVLMLDPWFKVLSLVGTMLAKLLQLRLQVHMILSLSSQLSRLCSRNCMDGWVCFQALYKKLCIVIMFVYGIGVFKDESNFEQVSLLLIFWKTSWELDSFSCLLLVVHSLYSTNFCCIKN